jgi:hypothetical protein
LGNRKHYHSSVDVAGNNYYDDNLVTTKGNFQSTNSTKQNNNAPPSSYYYSSPINIQSNTPQTQREHFQTTTTTLKSKRDSPNHPQKYSTDYMTSQNSIPVNGAFTRRHTAGVHEFSAQQITPQHIPAYGVEHLASFAVGKLFGLINPADGIRKLKQMERNSAICPVPMLFTLHPDRIAVLEENGVLF